MITACAVIDSHMCLIKLHVNGHAGFNEAGEDIVCSAVSILTRTAGRILCSELKNDSKIVLGKRGLFILDVYRVPDEKREWMKGVTMFVLHGLSDLEKDYPASVKLEITNNEEIKHES